MKEAKHHPQGGCKRASQQQVKGGILKDRIRKTWNCRRPVAGRACCERLLVQIVMKAALSSLLWTFAVLPAVGSVFIAPSNQVVYLNVPTNQTLLISSIKLGNFDDNGGTPNSPAYGLIVQDSVTNMVMLSNIGHDPVWSSSIGPYAIKGPSQIAFVSNMDPTEPAAVAVSYNLLQNSPLQTMLLPPGSTNMIIIPAGKSVRFLPPTISGFASAGFATLQDGTNSLYNCQINGGDEFTGPLTISVINPGYIGYSQLISFYFTDDFFVVPDMGCIQGPTGSFEIAVEKSGDLTSWSPVVAYHTGSDQKAFYRLRIQK